MFGGVIVFLEPYENMGPQFPPQKVGILYIRTTIRYR